MKKLFTVLFLPLLFPCLLFAQTEPGSYKQAVKQFTDLYNNADANAIFSMFDAKMQTALSLEKTQQVMNQLKTQLGDIKSTEFRSYNSMIAVYKTTFTNGVFALKIGLDAENKMDWLLVQPYQEEKTTTVDPSLTETPVNLTLPDASLSGSLIVPKNSIGKVPVVLIIAGSGPTDRNGNSGQTLNSNSYLLLANELGKAGIATLRYDKRAIGESTSKKSESDVRFDDFVNDANALVKMLKADPRFSKVITLGHSEGSLIGMVAAEREKVAAYVSVEGAGDRADKVIADQFKTMPEVYAANAAKLDSLGKGLTVSAASNNPLFRPSVQPYLISWFKYNPQIEITKLKVPVLILQGTTDIQVSVGDAQNLKKAKPNASLVLVEGMNHILKQAPADREQNIKTYNKPELPVDPSLIKTIVQFVGGLK